MGRATRPRWYLDPAGRHRLRYWTGTRWSEWVADDEPVARLDSTWNDETFPPPAEVQARSSFLRGCLAGTGLVLVFVGGGIRACDLALTGDEAESWARPAGVIIVAGIGLLLAPLALAAWERWKRKQAWPLWYALAPLLLVVVGLWGMARTTTVAPDIAVHGPRDCGSVFSPRRQHPFEARFDCDQEIAAQRGRSVTWIGIGLGGTAVLFTVGILARGRERHAPTVQTSPDDGPPA
jgi:hypothetical protein